MFYLRATFKPCKNALSLFEYLAIVSPSSVSIVVSKKLDKSKSSSLNASKKFLFLNFVF